MGVTIYRWQREEGKYKKVARVENGRAVFVEPSWWFLLDGMDLDDEEAIAARYNRTFTLAHIDVPEEEEEEEEVT